MKGHERPKKGDTESERKEHIISVDSSADVVEKYYVDTYENRMENDVLSNIDANVRSDDEKRKKR